MINSILAICAGCALLNNMDTSDDPQNIVCSHQHDVPSYWKDTSVDGPPKDGETYLILWKGFYIEAMWSDLLPMWYTPFFTQKKFIDSDEVQYYLELPSS